MVGRWVLGLLLILGTALPVYANPSNRNVPLDDITVTASAGLVYTPNNDLIRLSCTNHSASINIRWGDSTVTATKGQRIPAGASVEIASRAKIYMITESSTATLSCTVELR